MKLKLSLLSLVYLSLISCGSSISTAENEPLANDYVTTRANKIIVKDNLAEKIQFIQKNEQEAFSLKPKDNGLKLEGAQGEPVANLTVDDKGKIKIVTAAGSILGYVSGNSSYWQLEDAEETSTLFILRKQVGDNYQLESTNNQKIYSIKNQEYGYDIKTSNEEILYKVVKEAKTISLRDENDRIVLQTTSDFPLLAIACYGFDLLDKSQQTALAYAVSLMAQ